MNKILLLGRDNKLFKARVNALDLRGAKIFAPLDNAGIDAVVDEVNIIFGVPSISQRYIVVNFDRGY